jgi:hypothetical protein
LRAASSAFTRSKKAQIFGKHDDLTDGVAWLIPETVTHDLLLLISEMTPADVTGKAFDKLNVVCTLTGDSSLEDRSETDAPLRNSGVPLSSIFSVRSSVASMAPRMIRVRSVRELPDFA